MKLDRILAKHYGITLPSGEASAQGEASATVDEKVQKPSVLFKLGFWVKKIPNNSWSFTDFAMSRHVNGVQAMRLIKHFKMTVNSAGNYAYEDAVVISSGFLHSPNIEQATTTVSILLDAWRDYVESDTNTQLIKTVYEIEHVIHNAPEVARAPFDEAKPEMNTWMTVQDTFTIILDDATNTRVMDALKLKPNSALRTKYEWRYVDDNKLVAIGSNVTQFKKADVWQVNVGTEKVKKEIDAIVFRAVAKAPFDEASTPFAKLAVAMEQNFPKWVKCTIKGSTKSFLRNLPPDVLPETVVKTLKMKERGKTNNTTYYYIPTPSLSGCFYFSMGRTGLFEMDLGKFNGTVEQLIHFIGMVEKSLEAPDVAKAPFDEAMAMAGFKSKVLKLDPRWSFHSIERTFDADCALEIGRAKAMEVVKAFNLKDTAPTYSKDSPLYYSNPSSLAVVIISEALGMSIVRVKIPKKNYQMAYDEVVKVMAVVKEVMVAKAPFDERAMADVWGERNGLWATAYLDQDEMVKVAKATQLIMHNSGNRYRLAYPDRSSGLSSNSVITQRKPAILWKLDSNDAVFQRKVADILSPDVARAPFDEAHDVKGTVNGWRGETMLKMKIFSLKNADIEFGEMIKAKGTGWKAMGKNPDMISNDDTYLRFYRTESSLTKTLGVKVPSVDIQTLTMARTKELDAWYTDFLKRKHDIAKAPFDEALLPSAAKKFMLTGENNAWGCSMGYCRRNLTPNQAVMLQHKFSMEPMGGTSTRQFTYDPNGRSSKAVELDITGYGKERPHILIDFAQWNGSLEQFQSFITACNDALEPSIAKAPFDEGRAMGYMGWDNSSLFKGIYRARCWVYDRDIIELLKQHFHLAEVIIDGREKTLEYFKGDLTIYIPKVYGKGTGYNMVVRSVDRQKEVDKVVKAAGLVNRGYREPDVARAPFDEAKAKNLVQDRIKDLPDWSVSDDFVYYKNVDPEALKKIAKDFKMEHRATDEAGDLYTNAPTVINYRASKNTLYLYFRPYNQPAMVRLIDRILRVVNPDIAKAPFDEAKATTPKKALKWIQFMDEYEAEVPEAFARWYIEKYHCKTFKSMPHYDLMKGDRLNLVTVKAPKKPDVPWVIVAATNIVKIELSMKWASDEWAEAPAVAKAPFDEAKDVPEEVANTLKGNKNWVVGRHSVSRMGITLSQAKEIAKACGMEPDAHGGWYNSGPSIMLTPEGNSLYSFVMLCTKAPANQLLGIIKKVGDIVRPEVAKAPFDEQVVTRVRFMPGMRKKIVDKKPVPEVRFR